MKKRSLIVVLSLSTLLLQFCKKADDTTDTTTTTDTVLFQAYVNGALWTPTTTTAVLTYDASAKTKTLSFIADSGKTDQVLVSLKQPATAADSTFTLQTYAVDTTSTSSVSAAYNTLVNGVYTGVGTLKSGYIAISAIDPAKKLVTGTFSFNQTKYNYDTNGNVVSITSTAISSGEFNSFPYTFKKQ